MFGILSLSPSKIRFKRFLYWYVCSSPKTRSSKTDIAETTWKFLARFRVVSAKSLTFFLFLFILYVYEHCQNLFIYVFVLNAIKEIIGEFRFKWFWAFFLYINLHYVHDLMFVFQKLSKHYLSNKDNSINYHSFLKM